MKTENEFLQRGIAVEYVSLAWMAVECTVALYSGVVAWSLALLAFGGDSFVELLSSFAVVQHLRNTSTTRATRGGHVEAKRIEWVTALLLVSLIPMIGLVMVYSFLSGLKPESSSIGIAVAIGAVVIMPILWHEKKVIGTRANCLPLTIDAAESATCFWMSVALLSSLVINYFWRVPWIDYAATLVILAFVAKEAREALESIRQVC